MTAITSMLAGLDVESVVTDMDGAPGVMGYEGPALSRFVDVEGQNWVREFRRTKSAPELAVMREASTWAHLAHQYLADQIPVHIKKDEKHI